MKNINIDDIKVSSKDKGSTFSVFLPNRKTATDKNIHEM